MFRKMFTSFVLSSLIIILSSCAAANSYYFSKNLNTDEIVTATVGSPLLHFESGTFNTIYNKVIDGLVSELYYSGSDGNVVYLTYKEFQKKITGSYIRDSFGQELKYDISKSKIISFRNLKIEIIEANSNEITAKVIEYPSANFIKQGYSEIPIEQVE